MKFLKLEILNLASLDRPDGESIDFEHGALGDSTIFSIVGPTGSGKSTLLDAICLALYGNAPRYPLRKGERNKGIKIYGETDDSENVRLVPTDPRNILTRGRKNGYSKLTFLANDGTIYRAEWHVAFKRTLFDSAKTYLFKLVTKNGRTEEEYSDWNGLPSIIGLDYDQFLRTVLIAQGSFASFIEADENDRFGLLEKLIGCETLYTTITTKIKQKRDEAKSALDTLVTTYSVLDHELIKPEKDLQTVMARIAKLEEEERKTKTELGQVNDALGWYAQEKKHNDNLKTFQAALFKARQELMAFQEQAERLNLHDSTHDAIVCYKEILASENTIREQDEELKGFEKQIEAIVKAIREEKSKLQELVNVLDKAKKEIKEYGPHINRARTIKGELKAIQKGLEEKETAKRAAEMAMKEAREAVQKNAENIQTADHVLKKAQVDYKSLRSSIDEDRKKKADEENKAKNAYNAELEKAKKKDVQTLQKASAAALQMKNDIAKTVGLRQDIDKKINEVKTLEKENGELSKRIGRINEELNNLNLKSLKSELETLRDTRTLMSCEDWDKHRLLLKDGEECPLCGSLEHPYKLKEKLEPVLNSLDQLITGKEKQLDDSTELEKERSRKEATISVHNTSLEKLKKELDTLHQEWSDIHTLYPEWPDCIDALKDLQQRIVDESDKAGIALSDYNELVKKVDALRIEKEKAVEASRRYKEESDKELEQAETKITKAETDFKTEKGKTENLNSQAKEKSKALLIATNALTLAMKEVDAKKAEIKSEIGDHDPDQLENSLNIGKDNADINVKEQEKTVARLANEKNVTDGKIEAIRQNKNTEEQRLANKKSQLDEWLDKYNSAPEHAKKLTNQDIAFIFGMTEDWEALRGKQEALRTAVTMANTTYENEKTVHKRHLVEKPELTEDQLDARKKELEGISSDELVDLKTRKKRHDTAMTALGDIFQQKQEAELLKKEWDEVADSIGGDGKTLRKIAQCYTLRFLIEHANDEIRKFNTRYELMQVKNSLGIRVIDHDRADDIRDTTSLSGGETFIVSLGLALGLSSLSSRNISFGNLFIDEGFGTLDPDTLATVLDSLAMLQSSQGKKVGIISHTDTMSEHITTQIRIVKKGNSGSSHIELYP